MTSVMTHADATPIIKAFIGQDPEFVLDTSNVAANLRAVPGASIPPRLAGEVKSQSVNLRQRVDHTRADMCP